MILCRGETFLKILKVYMNRRSAEDTIPEFLKCFFLSNIWMLEELKEIVSLMEKL
jgi:hypothetical protein